ncbi:MAG TPA: hypothetical protein O0X39_03800 [Methanocorpusculum sp.]|nr:hypothetical protein [Methanocorpusculum sp.]
MKLNYTLTEEDYLIFNKSHFARSAYMQKNFSKLRIYMCVCAFMIPLLVSMTIAGTTYLWVGVIAGLALAVAFFFIYPKFYWHTVEKSLKKALRGKGRNLPPWSAPCSMSLEEDGVHFAIGSNDSLCPYDKLTDVVEADDGYVYVYFEKLQGGIIPPGVAGTKEFAYALKEKRGEAGKPAEVPAEVEKQAEEQA